MPRLWLKDYLVIAGGALLIAVFTLALAASPAAAQTVTNGPYYATPSWDQTLPASTRFVVLSNLNSEAVLDRETGLVWQRTPDNSRDTWDIGRQTCELVATGGREGWRLPSLHELESLIDPTIPFGSVALPSGHPFIGVGVLAEYWTGTTRAEDPTRAYIVVIQATTSQAVIPKSSAVGAVWCVRGGGPISVY